ncbi:Hypp7944 [Branchiostoma lanceolatum]|uniref:Hypp7944 protein n=1 Tax=Branchiostoma lanceolatum TaxID=7740 RepID=A0A8J9Z5Z5_BRALA|nr:Hypp7944 [Branchiostoma lanceolatum]
MGHVKKETVNPLTDLMKTALQMKGASTSSASKKAHVKEEAVKPSADMIKTALEKKRAFRSSGFRMISSDPPKITVTDGENGGVNVAVRLTSMPFIRAYRDPGSPKRKNLEKAAKEEIIRSFELPRDRVGEVSTVARGTVEMGKLRKFSIQLTSNTGMFIPGQWN